MIKLNLKREFRVELSNILLDKFDYTSEGLPGNEPMCQKPFPGKWLSFETNHIRDQIYLISSLITFVNFLFKLILVSKRIFLMIRKTRLFLII